MTNRKADEKGALAKWLHTGGVDSFTWSDYMDQFVENMVRKSTPDYEAHLRGVGQFWCELKSAARPKKKSTVIRFKFQEGQSRWLARRWYLGGSAWLLCQVGSGATASRYLIEGWRAGDVEEGQDEEWLQGRCSVNWKTNASSMIRCMAERGVNNRHSLLYIGEPLGTL